ncbi:uncharacterized protein LOC103313625 [Tribolium castaneum]|nr:PREDICTED: uncharacterized protein LOC103313625 [Tribolium castaneum]|eukprot:XP_015837448.1 PREDICTED: uncharacterized protein LOC103313625 [Tribolium castaneum]
MMSFFVFLLPGVEGFYMGLLERGRIDRHCRVHGQSSASSPSVISAPILPSMDDSNFSLSVIFISGLLFFLIFLGMLKGLLGLCCWDKIGMYGLGLLIELPRPLNQYQEKELERRSVVYDIGGWPIHPDTHERSVRVLPKRTEFCLNLIFFLAYPLAACVYICAFCCCIKNYNKVQDSSCFKHVDVIRLNECKNEGPGIDIYVNKQKEEQDTKYVKETMRKSRESLQYNVKVKTCKCHSETN